MFKIEKNIKVPFKTKGPGRPKKYPFDQMKPGDSFLVPLEKKISIRQRVCHKNKISKYKFITRAVKDGIRVWCLEK